MIFVSFKVSNVSAFSRAKNDAVVAAAWYTPWHASDFPLSQVSWSKYTHLIYAFATTTANTSVFGLTASDRQLIPQFVSSAHQHNVTAMLSIGGWTGSQWFSTHVRTSTNRTLFVESLINVVEHYGLDGLEFDWEYPALQGIGCNEINSDDTENFLGFLHELRSSNAGQKLVLSAAAGITPWIDSTGSQRKNMSDFGDVLDFISIMSYDIASNSSFGAGSSSPLDDSCAPISARLGSSRSAVAAWMSAGIPAHKLLLGVPSYGHSFITLSSQPGGSGQIDAPKYPLYSSNKPKGDRWDARGTDVCGRQQGFGGTYEYWGLIEGGFLHADGTPAAGIKYRFDDCSKTPFIFNSTAQLFISYEDPLSFAYKGGYILSAGLKGFIMWEAGGDYKDALLDSMLNATRTSGVLPSQLPSSTSNGAPSLWQSSDIRFLILLAILTLVALWH